MKTLFTAIAIGTCLLTASSCVDLGIAVDAESGPYITTSYPYGYFDDYYWNAPAWNLGPVGPAYRPMPPRPPKPTNNVSRPPQTSRPPTVNPGGPNGIGWNPGPLNRPGQIKPASNP